MTNKERIRVAIHNIALCTIALMLVIVAIVVNLTTFDRTYLNGWTLGLCTMSALNLPWIIWGYYLRYKNGEFDDEEN